ncbi:MAG: YciI family protein [Myxococcota bacterium]
MPRYLCLQRSIPGGDDSQPSPSDMQAMYAKFNEWRAAHEAQLVDLGGRLGEGRLETSGPIDGPFVEVKELAGGYMIVEAESLEQAAAVARGCPGLVRPGSGVEVIEIRTP